MLSAIVDRLRNWAASEDGQVFLLGFDYVVVSTKAGDFYAHAEWYLPLHPELMRIALEHVDEAIPFDERRAAALVGPGSEHWEWIVDGLLSSPTVATRRVVLEDVIFCLESGRWHAAVSTVLPVIEGVISDRSGILDGMRVSRRMDSILHQEVGRWDTLIAVPVLELLDAVFGHRAFADVSTDDLSLNRHVALHGRSVGYGTGGNACRLLMLLVAVVELLDGPVAERTELAPEPDWTILNEFGPLAPLRDAALARAAATRDRP